MQLPKLSEPAMQLRDAGRLNAHKLGLPMTGGNVDAAQFGRILHAM